MSKESNNQSPILQLAENLENIQPVNIEGIITHLQNSKLTARDIISYGISLTNPTNIFNHILAEDNNLIIFDGMMKYLTENLEKDSMVHKSLPILLGEAGKNKNNSDNNHIYDKEYRDILSILTMSGNINNNLLKGTLEYEVKNNNLELIISISSVINILEKEIDPKIPKAVIMIINNFWTGDYLEEILRNPELKEQMLFYNKAFEAYTNLLSSKFQSKINPTNSPTNPENYFNDAFQDKLHDKQRRYSV